MRHEIEAGTDAASLVLFDPAALPPDFEMRVRGDTVGTLHRLTLEGRACWINTEGDGSFLLHAYVDEPVPAELYGFVRESELIDPFHVPSGRLFLTGAEYAFRDDDSLLRNHPHMGGSISVRPGTYRLMTYRTRYPEGFIASLFRDQASWPERLLWNSMVVLIPLAVAAWIGLIVIFFTRVRVPFPRFLPAVLAVVFALPFLVRRLQIYLAAKNRYASLEREYPALVALLLYQTAGEVEPDVRFL